MYIFTYLILLKLQYFLYFLFSSQITLNTGKQAGRVVTQEVRLISVNY